MSEARRRELANASRCFAYAVFAVLFVCYLIATRNEPAMFGLPGLREALIFANIGLAPVNIGMGWDALQWARKLKEEEVEE